jgi:hypothetical protein
MNASCHPHERLLARAVSATLLGLLLTACGSDDTAPPDRSDSGVTTAVALTAATLLPGRPVPVPTGTVVLVIRGGSATNVGDELRLDLSQLESMGTVEQVVDDDFATGQTANFSGPLMSTVLDIAGAGEATTMHTVALNDYIADVPVSDAEDLPLVLATRMNGQPMSVANYGPTRFVYPTDRSLAAAVYEPRWVWQLATIELR